MYNKFTSELGFQKQHTRLLINGTRKEIMQAIDDMVDSMSDSDVVVFYFSGHVSVRQRLDTHAITAVCVWN